MERWMVIYEYRNGTNQSQLSEVNKGPWGVGRVEDYWINCTFKCIRSMIYWGIQKTGLIGFNRTLTSSNAASMISCDSVSSAEPLVNPDVRAWASRPAWAISERPARPKSVWKGSGMSPGRSAIPPVSGSCEARIKRVSLRSSIHVSRPRIVRLAKAHLRIKRSSRKGESEYEAETVCTCKDLVKINGTLSYDGVINRQVRNQCVLSTVNLIHFYKIAGGDFKSPFVLFRD